MRLFNSRKPALNGHCETARACARKGHDHARRSTMMTAEPGHIRGAQAQRGNATIRSGTSFPDRSGGPGLYLFRSSVAGEAWHVGCLRVSSVWRFLFGWSPRSCAATTTAGQTALSDRPGGDRPRGRLGRPCCIRRKWSPDTNPPCGTFCAHPRAGGPCCSRTTDMRHRET